MKPIFAKVLEGLNQELFMTRRFDKPYFSTEFHFHRECQLNFVIRSQGRRIIGDNVDIFESGEITFLGSDLPHVWHNDKVNTLNNETAASITLFFDPDKLIAHLSHFFNTIQVENFLQKAKRGIIFKGESKKKLKTLLVKIEQSNGIRKTILLLELLDYMVASKDYTYLSSISYVNTYSAKDNDKIDKVFKHIFDNYESDVSLEEVAKIANMTKQSFCRYFKARTQKTFVQFVNEVRVSQACRLISSEDNQIGNIAYDCGFNSLSNFNKIFKLIKGITPREYKNELLHPIPVDLD